MRYLGMYKRIENAVKFGDLEVQCETGTLVSSLKYYGTVVHCRSGSKDSGSDLESWILDVVRSVCAAE